MKTQPNAETVECSIEPFRDGQAQGTRTDIVAVEAPLEIRFVGRPGTILMRTPGHDDELVRGFLFAEGLIRQAGDILALERPSFGPEAPAGDLIDIRLGPDRKKMASTAHSSAVRAAAPAARRRSKTSPSRLPGSNRK